VVTYIVDGRKNFTGPRDLGALLEMARAAHVERVEMKNLGESEKGR
jgi:hypothetical protein